MLAVQIDIRISVNAAEVQFGTQEINSLGHFESAREGPFAFFNPLAAPCVVSPEDGGQQSCGFQRGVDIAWNLDGDFNWPSGFVRAGQPPFAVEEEFVFHVRH